MKKPIWVIGLVVIVVLSVACIVFWRQANIERTKMENLCQTSVYQSLDNFKRYAEEGREYLYTYGVAEFRSFMEAYLYLNDNESSSEYLYCNIVYGEMVLGPEKVQANMDKLIEVLTILAKDYTDKTGYIRMSEFGNLLRHGEE